MSWQSEMVLITRHLIDDLSSTPKYSDDRLIELILVSAQMVALDIDFNVEYLVDISKFSLAPDPTNPRDDAFIVIVCLKSSCLLARSEFRTSSGQGIAIKDGTSSIDLRNIAPSKKQVAETLCKEFEDIKLDYLVNHKISGQALVGPFRIGYTDSTYPENRMIYMR